MRSAIDGASIRTEADFHLAIGKALGFPNHYGSNLSALWDVLTVDQARPVELVWESSRLSRQALGSESFDRIVAVLRKVEAQDEEFGWDDRFVLVLS